jgi:hypothetical protein
VRRVLVVAGALLLVLAVVQQLALRDLRRLEGAYIAGREPTACATQALAPGAFSPDQSHLTDTVLALVTKADEQTHELRSRYRRTDHVHVPQLTASDEGIRRALDAQVRLYDAMVGDPAHSEPKLRTLGLANANAEHRLAEARRVLLVGATHDWKRRFICDTPI